MEFIIQDVKAFRDTLLALKKERSRTLEDIFFTVSENAVKAIAFGDEHTKIYDLGIEDPDSDIVRLGEAGCNIVQLDKLIRKIYRREGSLRVSLERESDWIRFEHDAVTQRVPGVRHVPGYIQPAPSIATRSFDAQEFNSALASCLIISDVPDRERINGVYLADDSMAATDGHRLRYIDGFAPGTFPSGLLIPREAAEVLTYAIKKFDAETVRIGREENELTIFADDHAITCAATETTYPDYRQVIPADTDYDARFIVESAAVLDAIDLVALTTNNSSPQVRMTIDDDLIELYASCKNKGESRTVVYAENGRGSDKMGFKPEYLVDVAKDLDCDRIEITTRGLGPAKVVDADAANPRGFWIVMPLRF